MLENSLQLAAFRSQQHHTRQRQSTIGDHAISQQR